MKIILKLFFAILITVQSGCKSGNEENKKAAVTAPAIIRNKPKQKLFANIQFASKRDTSCGMPISAGLEDTVHVNNKIYGFCSKECKNEFVNILKTQKKR